MIGTIALEEMEFFAHHGYYTEEQKLGNRYSVHLQIEVDFTKAAQDDNLEGTVNYEVLYQLVAEIMQQPTHLLEHIAQRIISAVFKTFPQIISITTSIAKHNPPIGGLCGAAKVTLQQHKS